MKYVKHTLLGGLLLACTLSLFAAGAQSAHAACSVQGYISSGGTCARSFGFASSYDDDNYRFRYQERFQDRFQNRFIDRRYDTRIDALQAYIDRLIALLEFLEELQDLRGFDDGDEFAVTTRTATDISDDEATLRGSIRYGDTDAAEVWFEYGTDDDDLDEETDHADLDEDDGEFRFFSALDDLDPDTRYYFRAVGEDEDGDRDRGRILSFTTDEDGSDVNEEPDLNTQNVTNVTDDAAELHGEVDMNDFADGLVFFVYGENEDQIADISLDYDTYDDIIEDDEDLQKVEVDDGLDGSDTYDEEVDGLDSDTEHFYAICVEYEDENDDETIACGDIEEFTTEE